MLTPIYEKGSNIHVTHYLAYGHTDNKLYADAAHTVKTTAKELYDACMYANLLVHDGTDYRKVIAFTESSFNTLDSTPTWKAWSASADE